MKRFGAYALAAAAMVMGSAAMPTEGGAQSKDGSQAAWIEAVRADGQVTLTIHAHLEPGKSGRYVLTTHKNDAGGSSTVRQGGVVPADRSGESGPLATSSVSLGENGTLVADLLVTAETGEEISDRFEIPAD